MKFKKGGGAIQNKTKHVMKSRKIIFIQKIFYLIKINLHKKNISIIVLKKT